MSDTRTHPFIEFLISKKEDRAMRARLKRGLGKEPGTVADMFRYVAPWLHEKQKTKEQNILFIVASLWASHPDHCNQGNLGDSIKKAATVDGGEVNPSAEKRFIQLLESEWEDLPYRLRQIISLLESKNQPVNYSQLMYDLKYWKNENRSVQRDWAASFWNGKASFNNNENQENNSTNQPKGE